MGQGLDRPVELGNFQRLPAGLVAALAAHGQVGADGVIEQRRVLQYHRDMLAHGFQANVLLGHPTKSNTARLRRV
ncbi:hypothetical protein D3C71_1918340 [compost metagenome]